jgi:hypothetical protein
MTYGDVENGISAEMDAFVEDEFNHLSQEDQDALQRWLYTHTIDGFWKAVEHVNAGGRYK